MKPKTILRKMNRGLLLGLVILIGLIIYISIDESNFKKEKPQIIQSLMQYAEDMQKVSITPTDYQKLDAKIPADVQQNQIKQMHDIINQYWTQSQAKGNNYSLSKSSYTYELEQMIKNNADGKGYIEKWSVKLEDGMNIAKSGPDAATVTARYTTVLEYAGLPEYICYFHVMSVDNIYNGGSADSKDANLKRLTITGEVTVEMLRINGEWKIVTAQDWASASNSPISIG